MQRRGLLIGLALLLAGCVNVNINVYFPAAAAEKAADRIIDEVWSLQVERSHPPAENARPQSDKTEEKSQ